MGSSCVVGMSTGRLGHAVGSVSAAKMKTEGSPSGGMRQPSKFFTYGYAINPTDPTYFGLLSSPRATLPTSSRLNTMNTSPHVLGKCLRNLSGFNLDCKEEVSFFEC